MVSLFDQLITNGFPFGRAHASALAAALIESDATDILDVRMLDIEDLKLIVAKANCPDGVLGWLQRPVQLPVVCKRRCPLACDASGFSSALDVAIRGAAPLRILNCGPSKAAKSFLAEHADTERWLQDSRIAAIAGSCPRSHASLRSSVRAYCMFALRVNRPALPPTIDMFLSWSLLFRCKGTFQNYVSNVRTACQLVGLDTSSLHDRVLTKAVRSIEKRRDYIARKPMFLCESSVRKLLAHGRECSDPDATALAMSFLTTYVFMLRMPSECLPMRVASGNASDAALQSVITVEADQLRLCLGRRKNKDGGSMLIRGCWCGSCPDTCPVHVLGPYFASCAPGFAPFAFIDARTALTRLRDWLVALRVPDARKYRTHDFRRGHARDMLRGGARLCEILKAGEWRSAAFLAYLDETELEGAATLEAHLGESSDEDVDTFRC